MYSLRTLFGVVTVAALVAWLVPAHTEWIGVAFLVTAFVAVLTAGPLLVALCVSLIIDWRHNRRVEK
jgi:hypothetical protein